VALQRQQKNITDCHPHALRLSDFNKPIAYLLISNPGIPGLQTLVTYATKEPMCG